MTEMPAAQKRGSSSAPATWPLNCSENSPWTVEICTPAFSKTCPRNIDTIPPGAGRRTAFDGVTVVLWRDGETSFRMDVWNTFAPHVYDLLAIGCRELAAESH